MGVTWTVWLVLCGAMADPDTAGRVARILTPEAVVRELARSADRFSGPPAWATSGVRGVSPAQVRRVLGTPHGVTTDPVVPGRVTWSYVVGSGGDSVRSVYFVLRRGRVEGSYSGRVTATPGGLLCEF